MINCAQHAVTPTQKTRPPQLTLDGNRNLYYIRNPQRDYLCTQMLRIRRNCGNIEEAMHAAAIIMQDACPYELQERGYP